MDVKKLSRGDAVIGGAALLMFIFSFMPYAEAGPWDTNFWARAMFPMAPSVVLLGLAAAAMSVLSRLQAPRETRLLGLTLGQFAVPLAAAVIWNALFTLMQKRGYADIAFGGVITLLMALVIGAAIIATPMVPALAAPLMSGAPAGAQGGYGAPAGYGAPGAQPYGSQPGQPFGAQPQPAQGQPFGAQPGHSQPGAMGQTGPAAGGPASAGPAAGGPASAAPFQPFWFAVPDSRPLHDPASNAQTGGLNPGTWYLAVAQHGQGLMVEVDGVRGVLWAVEGIQRS